MNNIKPTNIDYSPPRTVLLIEENVNGELYANINSFNGKTIWKISESYKNRKALVNALRYISKPTIIKINLESKHWKYIKTLELMIDKLWQ